MRFITEESQVSQDLCSIWKALRRSSSGLGLRDRWYLRRQLEEAKDRLPKNMRGVVEDAAVAFERGSSRGKAGKLFDSIAWGALFIFLLAVFSDDGIGLLRFHVVPESFQQLVKDRLQEHALRVEDVEKSKVSGFRILPSPTSSRSRATGMYLSICRALSFAGTQTESWIVLSREGLHCYSDSSLPHEFRTLGSYGLATGYRFLDAVSGLHVQLQVDRLGDDVLACPRTGLLARRAKLVERAWVRVAREAVGAEGQVVPQQWLACAHCSTRSACGRPTPLRFGHLRSAARRLRAVLRCNWHRHIRTRGSHSHATYPELHGEGPQKFVVLGNEVSTAMHSVWYETWSDYV
eukprot:s2904_g4.t1